MTAVNIKTKTPGGFMSDKKIERVAQGYCKNTRALAEFNILKDLIVKCKECGEVMRRHTQDDKWYYFCNKCMRNVWIEMPEYLA